MTSDFRVSEVPLHMEPTTRDNFIDNAPGTPSHYAEVLPAQQETLEFKINNVAPHAGSLATKQEAAVTKQPYAQAA